MNYEFLKSSLVKSKFRILFVGVLTALLGAGSLIGALGPDSKIVYWVFAGIFLAIGLLILGMALKGIIEIKSEKYPLIQAIKQKESDYVVWMYDKRIAAQVEGITVSKSSNVVIYNKHGKMTEIVLGRKIPANNVIDYLSSQFPDAHVGYDSATRETVSKILNQKL